jgi:hypothetical protein
MTHRHAFRRHARAVDLRHFLRASLFELMNIRRLVIIVAFAALLLAATQAIVDLRIRQIRLNSPIPISSLDRDDPVRRRFGMLHGVSMMLLLAQGVAAGVVVTAKDSV